MILDMGVDIRYNTPVDEHEGAARARASTPCSSAPARRAARSSTSPAATTPTASTSASTGSSRSPSATSTSIGERVLIIGVGNTAMDCCRSSRRLGGKDIKVMARRPRGFFKASPWELEDAEEEGSRDRRSTTRPSASSSRTASSTAWSSSGSSGTTRREALDTSSTPSFIPCDDVILAIGQENAFPWIERDIGIEFDKWDMPVVDKKTMQSHAARASSSAATRPGARRTSSGRSRTATGGDLDPQPLPGHPGHRAARRRA